MTRLYLCGPMSGLPEYNYPAFHAAAVLLREAGYTVTNPAENGLPPDAPWTQHMRADIKEMMDCDAVAVLPEYNKSRGAMVEINLATSLGMGTASVWTWLVIAGARAEMEVVE